MTITVVGGGLAGVVAAIESAERGQQVELFEATSRLGGRAKSTVGDHVANHGGHVVYADGPLWSWLEAKGLSRPAKKPPLRGLRITWQGESRRTPPVAAVRALRRVLRAPAPVEESLRDWATSLVGPEGASFVARACHVFSFDADPGRLSAAFCMERLKRALSFPPQTRYIEGGWGAMVSRLAQRATDLGVRIETGARVDEIPSGGPVIVAVELDAARKLLGDESLRWTGTRTAILDVAFTSRWGRDPFVVVDLDHGVFTERYTMPDKTLAPKGQELVQTQVGLHPDEELEDGVRHIEGVLDLTHPGWRLRETWRRRYVVSDATGALDLPGTTWRDRPAIDRGDGVYLCGDMVAAPGLLGEVAWASGIEAARRACLALDSATAAKRQ